MPNYQSRPAPPPQDFVARLIFDLRDLLQAHPYDIARAGRLLLAGVEKPFTVDLENRHLLTRVWGTRDAVESVRLCWDEEAVADDPLLQIECTCDEIRFYDSCAHVWAACTVALNELQLFRSTLRTQLEHADKNAWKRILNPLDQFLKVTRSTVPEAPSDAPDTSATRRLIYKVGRDFRYQAIFMMEQSVLKKGGWGKARKLTWGELASDEFDFLNPVDIKVRELARTVESLQSYSGYSYSSTYGNGTSLPVWELLQILEGHSLVFDLQDAANETPLKITKAEIELRLEPQAENMLAIVPMAGGRPLSQIQCEIDRQHGIVFRDMKSHALLMWTAKAPGIDLIQQLMHQPTVIPRDGIPEVLSRMTQLEGSFKVTYPPEYEGQTMPGNPQTILRLIPRVSDGGLAIEIWVRPQAGGAYFEPGEGANTVAYWAKEERTAVERDLPAELAAAQECRQVLNLNRFPSPRPWRWQLAGGDAALDFLAALQEHSAAPWIMEWSNSAVPRPHVVGEITPSDVELEIESDHDWFGVEGTIDVGGESVPLMAVLDALRNNSKYVQLKGNNWAKIAAEFRDRLAALADMLHRHQSKLNIDVTAAPLLEDLFRDQQINIRAATEWRSALQKLEQARLHNPQLPKDLKADLRDYQVEGFRWLSRLAAWGVGGCLADDMGLGKTVQALAAILERKEKGPTLVVAPVSVGFNWVNETTRFAPSLRPHLYRDTERGEFLSEVKAGDLVVASYGLLLRDAEYFTKVHWGTLVLDEAQFIKNSRTKSAQVVRDLQADWKLTLTGTPVENQLSDLWSLFRATSPGLFGSWERFRERFADPIEKQKLPERQQALARTVRPFILRRTKEEVLKELPARTEMILTAELSKPERKLYEDARLLALAQISGIDTGKNEARFQVLAMLTRLRQLACHPQLVDEKWTESSAKLDVLLETVEEIREGKHRALIFSQFTSHLDLIRKALDARKISYLYLDGQTPAKQRRERVEAFQAGEADLFLISLKAGGTGLNLTGADYVIHMDPWWNPAVEDQATDRAHRIGQTKPVMVYRLVAQDTIEEKILALHEKKRNLVAGIMEGSDQAGKLSTDELIDLIRTNHTPEFPADQSKPKGKPKARRKQPN